MSYPLLHFLIERKLLLFNFAAASAPRIVHHRQQALHNQLHVHVRDNLLLPLLIAIIASLALTASYHIPFNVPGLVIYYAIAQSHPELQKTGSAVEIGFAWVTIRQAWVWGLLSAYHMLFFAPMCLLVAWARTHRIRSERKDA